MIILPILIAAAVICFFHMTVEVFGTVIAGLILLIIYLIRRRKRR